MLRDMRRILRGAICASLRVCRECKYAPIPDSSAAIAGISIAQSAEVIGICSPLDEWVAVLVYDTSARP